MPTRNQRPCLLRVKASLLLGRYKNRTKQNKTKQKIIGTMQSRIA
jgi:hypothetical protein